ncbi:MAG: radical SAM protein [Candidatus Methanodesulfokora sp.]
MESMFKHSDWLIQLSPESHPRELMVEISTECNYNCVHCFRNATALRGCIMSSDLFSHVLEEASNSGVKKIVLSGWGEPTVHPNILKMLKELKDYGFHVALNTNGSKLLELAEHLIKLEIDELFVSIDAFDVKLYSQIRRMGDFSLLSKGLEKLRNLKLQNGSTKPEIKSIFTVNKLNVNEVSKALHYAKAFGVHEIAFSYYIGYPGGPRGLECLSSDECRDKLKEELEKAALKYFETGIRVVQPSIMPTTMRKCPFASNRALFIRCDGAVTPCIYYSRTWSTELFGVERKIGEVVLGNIRENKLMDLWRSSYSRMFFRLSFTNMPSCLDCTLQNYCSLTLSNEADCWGNKPSCAHCPYLHYLSYCPL